MERERGKFTSRDREILNVLIKQTPRTATATPEETSRNGAFKEIKRLKKLTSVPLPGPGGPLPHPATSRRPDMLGIIVVATSAHCEQIGMIRNHRSSLSGYQIL
jgi:hypothetical protein